MSPLRAWTGSGRCTGGPSPFSLFSMGGGCRSCRIWATSSAFARHARHTSSLFLRRLDLVRQEPHRRTHPHYSGDTRQQHGGYDVPIAPQISVVRSSPAFHPIPSRYHIAQHNNNVSPHHNHSYQLSIGSIIGSLASDQRPRYKIFLLYFLIRSSVQHYSRKWDLLLFYS